MTAKQAAPRTLLEAVTYFSNEEVAHGFLAMLRWPDGKQTCPQCGVVDEHYYLESVRRWKCRSCRKQFSIKIGTIFEDSPIKLSKWLPAVWFIVNCKNGISSHELARAVGVTQKSAWFMLHRIRLAMQAETFDKISGEVEADETWIGGKRGNMHKAKQKRVKIGTQHHMTAVMGLLERKRGDKHSTVRLSPIPNTRMAPLENHIRANVAPGSTIFSDAHPSYRRLKEISFGDEYAHAAVDHAMQYVDGLVHTNGLENFWSLLKRSIRGTYVSVDPFHLFRYLDEQAFRFNNRETTDGGRFMRALRSIVGKRLRYDELISAGMAVS